MKSRLSTLATCWFGVQTSLEALRLVKLPSLGKYSLENLHLHLSAKLPSFSGYSYVIQPNPTQPNPTK